MLTSCFSCAWECDQRRKASSRIRYSGSGSFFRPTNCRLCSRACKWHSLAMSPCRPSRHCCCPSTNCPFLRHRQKLQQADMYRSSWAIQKRGRSLELRRAGGTNWPKNWVFRRHQLQIRRSRPLSQPGLAPRWSRRSPRRSICCWGRRTLSWGSPWRSPSCPFCSEGPEAHIKDGSALFDF